MSSPPQASSNLLQQVSAAPSSTGHTTGPFLRHNTVVPLAILLLAAVPVSGTYIYYGFLSGKSGHSARPPRSSL